MARSLVPSCADVPKVPWINAILAANTAEGDPGPLGEAPEPSIVPPHAWGL
jgi:hypothetical protein